MCLVSSCLVSDHDASHSSIKSKQISTNMTAKELPS